MEAALQALRQEDAAGLEWLFDNYYGALCVFADSFLKHAALAEEIAADAFVRLWSIRRQFREQGSVTSWLYTTVRNACIDQLRKEKSRTRKQRRIPSIDPAEEPVLEKLIEAETVRLLMQQLQALPPGCGQVVRLIYLEQASGEEAAAELGLAPSTIRNQKMRGLRLLRKTIGVENG